MTIAKATSLKESRPENRRLATNLEGKLPFLIIFAILYGLIFINYIDVNTLGSNILGYHLWLAFMYFLPFVILSIFDIRNWRLTIGLGFITSLMNDLLYGAIQRVIKPTYNLVAYYNKWLIPQSTILFHMNLGFAVIPITSWMMALSIYLRIAVMCLLLKTWDISMPKQINGEIKIKI